MNKSYGVTLNLTYEHLSISIQLREHESIQAYEHLSTQIHISLTVQSTPHSSTIVKTF